MTTLAPGSGIDPILLAVVKGSLNAAVRNMREVLIKTAQSPIIAIAEDFSNAIFARSGEQIAIGEDQPVHIGSMQQTMYAILQHVDEVTATAPREGDLIFVNDPVYGVGHLQDMTMVMPVFIEGELAVWVMTRAHMADVGGSAAGGYNADATEIYAEGIRVPPVHLKSGGVRNQGVYDIICTNVRSSTALAADMSAQEGALASAAQRVAELCHKVGRDRVLTAIEILLDRSEELMRSALRALPEGEWTGQSSLELPGEERLADIEATVRIGDGRIHVRLSSPQQTRSYINSYRGNTLSAVYAAIFTGLPEDIEHDGGAYRCIEVDPGQPGTLTNALDPAPCSLATSTPFDSIMEATQACVAQFAPSRAVAGWAHLNGSTFSGRDPRSGRSFSFMATFTAIGGAGAMWDTDGWSCCGPQCTMGAMKTGNIEEIELRVPILIEQMQYAPDSEGPGEHRGGFGVHTVVRAEYGDVTVTNFGDQNRTAPPGRLQDDGFGARRAFSKYVLDADGEQRDLEEQTTFVLRAGERLVRTSPGGGGIGDPQVRDRDAVRKDVEASLISAQRARDVYGWPREAE